MWPYDYFNQYSALEIDEKMSRINSKKKIFIAMDFGDEKKQSKEEQDSIYEALQLAIESMDITVSSEVSKDKVAPSLRYRLEAETVGEKKFGAISINILGKILESVGFVAVINKNDKLDNYFNSNVMTELGLALAWKMPEQVLILLDEGIPFEDVPFDLKDYFTHRLNIHKLKSRDSEEQEKLRETIKDRLESFEVKKDVIVKSLKSKIDSDCLGIIQENRGLLFSLKASEIEHIFHNTYITTIRHLLNLGVIKAMLYPRSLDFAYALTEAGKKIARALKIELYPDIVIDMNTWILWYDYPENEKAILDQEFLDLYKEPINSTIEIFDKYIPEQCKTAIRNLHFGKSVLPKDMLHNYVSRYPYSFVKANTIEQIKKANLAISKYF